MSNKKRILHVDDDPDTLKIVNIILTQAGYEVVSASNGKTALKYIKEDNFDLMLFDIMMPDISGWNLFQKTKELGKVYPIIFLTVLDVTQSKLKTIKAEGVADYITKPFDKADLVTRVKKVIS